MAGQGHAQLARRGDVVQPGCQDAGLDQGHALVDGAFVIEGRRAQAPGEVGVIHQGDIGGEDGLAQPVLEEGDPPRHGGTADRAEQGTNQGHGDPVLEDDRCRRRGDFARAQPPSRPPRRLAADLMWRRQVGEPPAGQAIVSALHAFALAGNYRGADVEARGPVLAEEAVRGGEAPDRPGRGCGPALGVGDARHVQGGGLGLAGQPFEGLRIRIRRIEEVEGRVRSPGLPVGIDQARPGIFRCHARHGHGPLNKAGAAFGRDVRSRHRSLAAADEDPEAEVPGLFALDLFQGPEPDIDRKGLVFGVNGFGGVGARLDGGGDKINGEVGHHDPDMAVHRPRGKPGGRLHGRA